VCVDQIEKEQHADPDNSRNKVDPAQQGLQNIMRIYDHKNLLQALLSYSDNQH
jgi:hypothetical protein